MHFPCVGKCHGQRSLVAAGIGGDDNRLLFIQDSILGRRFLCDKGAQKSGILASSVDTLSDSHAPPHGGCQWQPHQHTGH